MMRLRRGSSWQHKENNVNLYNYVIAAAMGALLSVLSLFHGVTTQAPSKDDSVRVAASPASGSLVCTNEKCECVSCECNPCVCNSKADDRPIIYYFYWKQGCPGCNEMKPVVQELKDEGYRVWEIDSLDPANARYVKFYGVRGVPQFITVNPEGYEIRRTRPGKVSKSAIVGKSVMNARPVSASLDKVGFAAPAATSCSSCSTARRSVRWRR